jgi:hypothetical protein
MGPNQVETEETMTISRLVRKFAGSEYCAALGLPNLGCSDDKANETPGIDMDTAATWGAAKNPEQSRLLLDLDISHHGGTRGRIVCDTDDDGELTISGELMTALIGLGVAGFPTVELTRVSSGGADIAQGCVQLRVSSFVCQAVTVADVTSCTDTTCSADSSGWVPCPDGMTCRSDLVCE